VVDAQRFGSVARFINHSGKKPNCVVRVVQVAGAHTVCIFAAVDIDAGRELFFDYHHGRAGLAPDWLDKQPDKVPELLSLRRHMQSIESPELSRSIVLKKGHSEYAAAPAHKRKK
jgi:hypothetical protein